jgi:SAM-dependent methyltransferase
VAPGDHVLDVGCGTGALSRAVSGRVGPQGSVSGLDISEEMLDVARTTSERIRWRLGRAEALPFDDGSFDHVLSQFAAMFFTDRVQALREMARVVRPGGRVLVAVCDAVDASAGYSVLTELIHRLFGPDVAQAFRAPFALGDRAVLRALAEEAGLRGARVEQHRGQLHFDSVEALVAAERACAWTLGGLLDDDQFGRLLAAAEDSLAPFRGPDGEITLGMPVLAIDYRA